MQPGKLRHRVNIQAKSPSQDDYGEPIDEWVNVWENVPAQIEDLSGREYWAAQQIQAEINTEITIRWRKGITAMHRIVHQTSDQRAMSPPEMTIYDIASPPVVDETGRREIKLMCINRSNAGFRSGSE